MLDIDVMLELNKDIVLRNVGDKFWALNVTNGNQYKLNAVAYYILDHIRTPGSVEQITASALKEYDVTREQFVADCTRILHFAIDNAIIKEVSL